MPTLPSPIDIAHLHYAIARALARNGLFLVACRAAGGREPLYLNWPNHLTTPEQVERWWTTTEDRYGQIGVYAGSAIGINCGPSNLLVVDDDTRKKGLPLSFPALAAQHDDDLSSVPMVATPGKEGDNPRGGSHFYFRHDHAIDPLGNSEGSLPQNINVRGKGGYVFAPASFTIHGQYGDLGPARIITAPPVPKWLRAMLSSYSETILPPSCGISDLPTLIMLLDRIDPDTSRRVWITALMAIHEATGGSPEGRELAHKWSAQGAKYREPTMVTNKGEHVIDYYWRDFSKRTKRFKYGGETQLEFLGNDQWYRSLNTKERDVAKTVTFSKGEVK